MYMNMLKIDEKLCKLYKKGVKVKNYFKTQTKMCRMISFEDGTHMHIETKAGEGTFFKLIEKNVEVINQCCDIDDRIITIFKIKQ